MRAQLVCTDSNMTMQPSTNQLSRLHPRPITQTASRTTIGSPRPLPKIAVLGAGHSGPVIARAAVEAGYEVSIAASDDPEQIA